MQILPIASSTPVAPVEVFHEVVDLLAVVGQLSSVRSHHGDAAGFLAANRMEVWVLSKIPDETLYYPVHVILVILANGLRIRFYDLFGVDQQSRNRQLLSVDKSLEVL